MDHFRFYHHEIPPFLEEFSSVPIVRRLQCIGMNCGCEYTDFPLFRNIRSYSRYDHSMGVALIVWHFTQNCPQAVAGLLHDIATPVFAHVVDFLNGDYLQQESTEADTEAIIAGSSELQKLLKENSLSTPDVCDYHRYPIADNESPRLSADRLEYSLGNMINFGICTAETVRQFYADLTVGTNEISQEELMFRTPRTAEAFAMAALNCSRIYVSDEDRYSMQILSEVLRYAVDQGILTRNDLYTTEPEVIAKLQQDERTAALWEEFRSLHQIIRSDFRADSEKWRTIRAKKRWIDPFVENCGRVSMLSSLFYNAKEQFLRTSQDYPICGISQ